jgi:hypothetical protein
MKTSLLLIAIITLALTACNNGAKTDNTKSRENGSAEETILNPKFDPNKIHGLGIFKIGVSIDSSIGKLLNEQHYKYDSICNGNQARQSSESLGPVYRVNIIKPAAIPDDLMAMYIKFGNGLLDKKVVVYQVETYMVDSANIYNLVAKYYHNKLVFITCNFDESVEMAIRQKYGSGEAMKNDPTRGMKDGWHQYDNGDLVALYGSQITGSPDAYVPPVFELYVKDARSFFNDMGKVEYAKADSIYKAQKNNGLKNL